jgi:hypothetical protein
VEEEEDEHLYHPTGWTRSSGIEALGMPAVIPPPEDENEVKTAIGAARAKQARKQMLYRRSLRTVSRPGRPERPIDWPWLAK